MREAKVAQLYMNKIQCITHCHQFCLGIMYFWQGRKTKFLSMIRKGGLIGNAIWNSRQHTVEMVTHLPDIIMLIWRLGTPCANKMEESFNINHNKLLKHM